jgi:sec-independent protein translocase protein TatA
MGELSPWHWLIVIAAFVVLFGSQRLPGAARALGQSLRVLKAELRHDDAAPGNAPASPAGTPGSEDREHPRTG